MKPPVSLLRRLFVAAAIASLGACASVGPVRPLPFPGVETPAADTPRTATGTARPLTAVVTSALALRGIQYRAGGQTPRSGFDCSGLVEYAFAQSGITLPRTVAEQFAATSPVKKADLRPGDLVFFSTLGPGPTHVGIVVSMGQHTEFVHAPGDGSSVRVERFDTPYWERRWAGGGRVF